MAKILLRDVSKTYPGNVRAVHKFNLEIKDKEFIILVGPSGCGKSTTLRMIAGLEKITSGDIYIEGRLVNNIHPKDRDIAMVFQNYALYPHMTVFKNMAFSLNLKKMKKDLIRQRVGKVAKILSIDDLLNRKPKELSGGQRQRVALGRAMVRNPKVFLLDEPLSNLDAKLRAQTRTEISKLHKKLGTTFVYVTHDQTEAMTMGDRIVVMKDGLILQVDTPQNLYNDPQNIFVASFIGSPQMNFLDVTIHKKKDIYYARTGELYIQISKIPYNKKLEKYLGKEVILGIRPEDIYEREFGNIYARVEIVEKMGFENYLYIDCHSYKLTVKVPPTSRTLAGDKTILEFNEDKIYLFDKETEETILGFSGDDICLFDKKIENVI